MSTILLAAVLSAPPDGSYTRPIFTVPRSGQSSRQSNRRPQPRLKFGGPRRANLQPRQRIKRIYLYETTIPQGVPFHMEYRFKSGHVMTIRPQGINVMLDPIIMIEQDNQFKRK